MFTFFKGQICKNKNQQEQQTKTKQNKQTNTEVFFKWYKEKD